MMMANDMASRLSDNCCWASDDEGARRVTTPAKSSKGSPPPLASRSLSFSMGTTPGKQYPTRMSISPATSSVGNNTPRKMAFTPTKTPSKNSGQSKAQINVDPMSVCKGVGGNTNAVSNGGAAGKENSSFQLPMASPSSSSSGRKKKTQPLSSGSRRYHLNHRRTSSNTNHDRYTYNYGYPAASGDGESDDDNGGAGGGGGGGDGAKAFNLMMPPPLPRTPSGKGTSSSMAAMKTTPISPLQLHDPNQAPPSPSAPRAMGGGGGDGVGGGGRGRVERNVDGGRARVEPFLSPATTSTATTPSSSRARTFNLGSASKSTSHVGGGCGGGGGGADVVRERQRDPSGGISIGTRTNSRTSSRGATAAAARCAPTPPRRLRSPRPQCHSSYQPTKSFFSMDEGPASATAAAAATASSPPPPPCSPRPQCRSSHDTTRSFFSMDEGCSTPAVGSGTAAGGVGGGCGGMSGPGAPSVTVGPAAAGEGGEGGRGGACGGMSKLLNERAREFAEQAAAEALVGLPWQAARGFTRALRIVSKGSLESVELLLARAQVLSTMGKHEACAEDCRAALGVDSRLLRALTLLGHAYLRLGMHGQASQSLRKGLDLASTHPDPSVKTEALRACSTGIQEASLVGSALESGARAASHGQHSAALAAAGRVLEIAPQCVVAQEMQAAAMLGLRRPVECTLFCEAGCIRPRADPGDESVWPPPAPAPGCPAITPVLAALGMAQGVARYYVSALRGCGREHEAIPTAQALRCRDPSLEWCLEDTARWVLVGRLRAEGLACAAAGDYDSAVTKFTQAMEADPGGVIPNAEVFCLRGSSRLGQGNALEALDDCYAALQLVSLEGGGELIAGPFAMTRGKALLVRGRAYLALSRLAEAVSDLQGCLKCDPSLEQEARAHLAKAQQKQSEAGLQRQQRERQERERKEKQAETARVEAAARAKVEKARRDAAARVKEQAARSREEAARVREEAAKATAEAKAKAEAKARAAAAAREARRNHNSSNSGKSSPPSPFPKPETPSSRSGCGGGAWGDTMKTPARVRSPKIDSESYYRRLGLAKDASEATIKKAYRKLALKYHPDKNKSEGAAHSFRLVSEAYRILTSPDSKLHYDRTRRYSIETPPSNGARAGAGAGGMGAGRAGSSWRDTGGSRADRGERRDESWRGGDGARGGARGDGSGNTRSYGNRGAPSYW